MAFTEKELQMILAQDARRLEHTRKAARERDGMELRSQVLQASLHIEEFLHRMFVEHLGIDEAEVKIKLSFDQEVLFLFAIGEVDDEGRKLFNSFRRIRNLLIHNLQFNSLEKCFQELKNEGNLVLELAKSEVALHPAKYRDNMNLNRIGMEQLIDQVTLRLYDIEDHAIDRRANRVMGDFYEHMFDSLNSNISKGFLDVAKSQLAGDKPSYTRQEVIDLFTEVFKAVRGNIDATAKAAGEEFNEEVMRRAHFDPTRFPPKHYQPKRSPKPQGKKAKQA